MPDFDVRAFIEDMRACKPPYRCPFDHCARVYKTFSGINGHLQQAHAADEAAAATSGAGGDAGRSPSPQPFFRSPVRDSLVYDEAAKRVEFEAEGRLHRLSVYEPLELVDKKDWEASLPVTDKREEAEVKKEDEPPKTPAAARVPKKRKTPKSKPPPTPAEGESAGQNDKDGEKTKLLKLPEAHFKEVEDYKVEDAPPLPDSYYRFIERPAEEQDEEVEYDMDEEDVAWLDIINEKRSSEGLQRIKEDQFELLMDRLEKESYFHVQTNGKESGYGSAPIDDDAICCVCMDGECSNTNVILFCDLCNLAVHQECYGVPYIPEGQWLCRRCLQSPSRSVECCLCPNKGGAFKQTDDGRWAHVVCGLWIPEVRFANTVFLEPIDSIDNIPPARWKLSCRVCKQRGVGACIQCHKTNCYTAFHVTCGLLAGLHMKMDTVRESSVNGLSVTVRKTAFCDVHTPQDSDCKPQLEDVSALGISTAKQKAASPKKAAGNSPVPVLFRGLMNFSPQCPWEKVQEIASLIEVQRKNQFFQRLMAYWTLKRQTRNGVPLIRRLQFAKAMRADKKPETPQKNAHHSKKKKEAAVKERSAIARKAADEFKEMLEQRKLLRRVRQDLERVRLLCELIRKREQRKKELIVNKSLMTEVKCWPLIVFMRGVLDNLKDVDHQEIFAEPVSLDDVPDYLDHVKVPMDFSTMREKLDRFEYSNVDQLEEDFNLMVGNCLSYNERDTIFFRAGVKMRDQGGSIIRQARRTMESVGYDSNFCHDGERKNAKPVAVPDDQIMKEIDSFLYDDEDDDENDEDDKADEVVYDEEHLKKLLELQDKAQSLHHPVAKAKRLRLLKSEIIKTRRKLTLDKSGLTPGVKKQDPDSNSAMKKKKTREVSPVQIKEEEEEDSTPGRRLRTDPNRKTPVPVPKRGKKRGPKGSTEGSSPPAKKQALDADLKNNSPAKSPAGVNRRNAVLFTRKKQSAAAVNSKEESLLDEQETSIEPAQNDVVEKKEKKKRGRKPKSATAGPQVTLEPLSPPPPVKKPHTTVPPETWQTAPPKTASFQEYRRGGEVGETDDDTQSESATDALVSDEDDNDSDNVNDSDDSDDDSDTDDEDRLAARMRIPLEPLDLVWAKCRGYPWYPALIINPKMPRTGYLHNGVPIPVPPQDVLDMAHTHTESHYLILFFDAKRTWQWLTRDKLEPLGGDFEMDKAKLVQSKKAAEKKAVKKAYEDAIMHRCKVTGENSTLSEDASEKDEEAEESEDKE